jgi:hypothetical protein
MAKNVTTPEDVQIASMQKGPARLYRLMEPGDGTPWEDRGSIGTVTAFFKTCFQSMFSPGKLFESIRRPETAGDARVFVFICAGFWAVAWVLQDFLSFRYENAHLPSRLQKDFSDLYPILLIHLALAIVGTWLLHMLVSRLFYKLVQAGDVKAKAPAVLTYNVYAYCLGPSILALIPFYIGPGIAIAWIFFLCVYAAITRLAVKTSGAITCNVLAFGGLVGGGAIAYHFLYWLIGWLYS